MTHFSRMNNYCLNINLQFKKILAHKILILIIFKGKKKKNKNYFYFCFWTETSYNIPNKFLIILQVKLSQYLTTLNIKNMSKWEGIFVKLHKIIMAQGFYLKKKKKKLINLRMLQKMIKNCSSSEIDEIL